MDNYERLNEIGKGRLVTILTSDRQLWKRLQNQKEVRWPDPGLERAGLWSYE